MKARRYSGPISTVTLADGRRVRLFPGRTYTEADLPLDHPHVAILVARRHLTEVPVATPVVNESKPPRASAAGGRGQEREQRGDQ